MKARLVLLLAAGCLALATLALVRRRGESSQPPVAKRDVPIRDGKTIDFSTGKPVVKEDAANKAALERAMASMEAAAGDVTFAPRPNTPK